MHEKQRARLVAYGVAVVAPAVTLLVRWPLDVVLGDRVLYIAFFPAVLLAAYYGGFWPGLLATVLSALAATYFLVEPLFSLRITTTHDAIALTLFVLVGAVISALSESRLRSHRRIAASERRYAVTLASIGDAVIATDTRARVTLLNPAAEALTGWPLTEAVGRPLSEVFRIVNEQTRQRVEDPAAKVLRTGTVVGLANHTALIARDGREVPIDDCGAPIIDDPGAIAGVVLVFRDVSQRRQAEEAEVLRRANERMELAVRGSNVGVWDIDMPDGDYQRGRRHYMNIWEQFGYERPPEDWQNGSAEPQPDDRARSAWTAAAASRPPWETAAVQLHPDDRGRIEEAIRRYLAGETAEYETEARFRHEDGSYHTMLARGVAVRDAAGKPIRFVGILLDITKLRRAEEALSQERYLLNSLMDNIPDKIYFKDAASRFPRINKALATFFGLADPAEAIGKTDFDFFAEEHAGPAYEDEQEIIRTGQPVIGKEEKGVHLDGRMGWVSTTKMPLRDKDGTIVGTFGVSRNITKLKLAEEALRESEQRWRSLTEALPQLVWSATPDGACDYFSTQWTEHTGVAEAELLGWRWLETLHPEDRDPTRQFWLESVAGRHPYDVEYRVRRRDGEYRWFKTRGVPVRDGGAIVKWFGTCTDITDLRQTEEALRASQQRFRVFVDHAADGFYLFDHQSRILDVNRLACESLGYTRDEILGMTPFDFDPDVTAARLEEIIRKLEAGETIAFETRHRRKDGIIFPVEVKGKSFWEGGQQRTVTLARDITERKRAEEALRESEERFRTLAKATNDAVWDWDLNTNKVWWNEGVLTLFGYRLESNEADPAWWLERVHPDDREAVEAFFFEVVRGKDLSWVDEYRFLCADGSYKDVYDRGYVLRDPEGRAVRMIGAMLDITERKRAEGALREARDQLEKKVAERTVELRRSERHLAEAQRLSHTGSWARNMATGECTHSSEEHSRLFGFDPELGVPSFEAFSERIHPEDRATVIETFARAVRDRTDFEVDYRTALPDGTIKYIHGVGHPVFDAADYLVEYIGTAVDVTERKRAEEELRAREAAEAANRAKDEFLANVSHEIRTPMNAILGMTELVLDTPLTEDQRQSLRTVKSAADNLLGIINDLLDFSKIEAGKMELAPANFSLRGAVGDTLQALAVRAHTKGLELIYQVQPDVPDALVGDAGRLRQVLLNLVGNAIKFTDTGEVVVRVETHGDASPSAPEAGEICLRFTVRDTGIGIPPEQQERIFRAFEQEDTSTTRKYGGTGLGLSIASRLVALMGGEITVDSELGRGSTFAFTARFGRRPHQPEPAASRQPILHHNLRVLIVDDNATNRHILEEWLRGWQMEPAAVGDGLAALDALWDAVHAGRPYALVLLDARMPDTDGLALAAKIRKRAELSATRIILLTSGDRPGDLARSRAQRVDAHLLKPVQQDELLETIYRVMGRGDGNVPPAASPAGEGEQTQVPTPAARPLRVLVAEDNEFNAQLLEQLLGRRGHRVRLATNGREALCLAGEGGFDLLLLDVHMPELDGFQVAQAVRERERTTGGHLPIIALTARSRKEDRERCLAAGMDDFLAKPIQAADLWAAIDRGVGVRPPADRPGPGLLDPRVLLAACGGDGAILEKLCQAFRARLPDHLKAVQDALRDRDAPRLREAAHKLSGMVAAFSTVASGVASDVEDDAARGQLEEARPLVDRLEAMAQELIRLAGALSLETLRQQAEAHDDLAH